MAAASPTTQHGNTAATWAQVTLAMPPAVQYSMLPESGENNHEPLGER